MSRLTNLYRLQEVDEGLREHRDRLEEIARILAENERVAQAEKALEGARSEFITAKSSMGEAEQAVASQRAKIEKTESSLYGGEVSNPKELEDLQMESESLKRYLETLEDRLLEAMVEFEEAEHAFEAAKNELEEAEKAAAAEQSELSEEREDRLRQVQRMETEREAAVSNVAEKDLDKYGRVRSKVGHQPLAIMEGGTCGVCGMNVPGSKQQMIRAGDEIVRCTQCGRILYAG